MVMFLPIVSVVPRVIEPAKLEAKTITSSGAATARASRSEQSVSQVPSFVSANLVTVSVEGESVSLISVGFCEVMKMPTDPEVLTINRNKQAVFKATG